MDKQVTLQIVAAILAGHAAQGGNGTDPSVFVTKYISMLEQLKRKKDDIDKALDDYDPELHAKLGQ